ncbi:hypothetical protein NIES4072_48220 [Nostoc commune NIES-4072]|uniref:Uncharacterized protein n=1 Tax=Nostoc commune NIES-4072 TaxID=2005467 RepID=A0A2R5FSZ5_NOSCO|nr:hypothetical protein [Nostoc commune]BBD67877.1 hypothetical protein NIES4070_42710 [Nostoc commune HK-02]GBG21139.1 hypothetical protein NIES4072_48220 [Nostoc commune NIES-4072]
MATTHGPSENNYLAATPENDQIYGYKSNDTGELNASPTEKVLILQSLVCNSTAAGGDNPDQISLIIQGNDENSLNFLMFPKQHVPLAPWSQNFHSTADIELFAGSKRLGRETVSNSGDSPLSFTKRKASYTLTFLVNPTNSSAI